MNVVSLNKGWNDGVSGFISHKILASLLLAPQMLTVLDPLHSRDFPDMKFQLDLTPFGVGVPSGMKAWFPYP